jgi:hypothetical protein
MPETKAYVGTKIIRAFRDRHEDGRDGYRVIYPDGYESWSPKESFEASYREISDAEKKLI